jgi:hypothetical protein
MTFQVAAENVREAVEIGRTGKFVERPASGTFLP